MYLYVQCNTAVIIWLTLFLSPKRIESQLISISLLHTCTTKFSQPMVVTIKEFQCILIYWCYTNNSLLILQVRSTEKPLLTVLFKPYLFHLNVYLLNLLVNYYSNSTLCDIKNTSSFAVVDLVGHSFMNSTINLDKKI